MSDDDIDMVLDASPAFLEAAALEFLPAELSIDRITYEAALVALETKLGLDHN
jgi:hypothetical protein